MKVDSDVGTKLKRLRFDAGINQNTLAEKIDLTASYISAIENRLKTPSMYVVDKWCGALGYTVGFTKIEVATNPIKIDDNNNRQENRNREETGEVSH